MAVGELAVVALLLVLGTGGVAVAAWGLLCLDAAAEEKTESWVEGEPVLDLTDANADADADAEPAPAPIAAARPVSVPA